MWRVFSRHFIMRIRHGRCAANFSSFPYFRVHQHYLRAGGGSEIKAVDKLSTFALSKLSNLAAKELSYMS